NDISCPNGTGLAGCVETSSASYTTLYGNYVHNVGDQAGSITKYYHAIYFTTNSNFDEVGWNEIAPNPNRSTTSGGCPAPQFYSTGGSNQHDISVHDNVIHDAICDGINMATVDPAIGPVKAFNNLVYHVGTGPDPKDGSSNYSCINVGGGSSTPVEVVNNTFY